MTRPRDCSKFREIWCVSCVRDVPTGDVGRVIALAGVGWNTMPDRHGSLIADRFFQMVGGRVVDLATGRDVHLVVRDEPPGAPVTAWRDRCERLVRIWHSHVVPLCDFALLPDLRLLEAYDATTPAKGMLDDEADDVWLAVAADFESRGLCPGVRHATRFRTWCGRVVLQPDAFMGIELAALQSERGSRAGSGPPKPLRPGTNRTRAVGIQLIVPRALDAVVPLLDTLGHRGPRGLRLYAPPGVGLTTLLGFIAREARARGCCPVCPMALARCQDAVPALAGRTVVLLEDEHVERGPAFRNAAAMLAAAHVSVAAAIGIDRDGLAEHDDVKVEPLCARQLASRFTLFPPRPPSERYRRASDAIGIPGWLVSRWLEGGRPRARQTARVDRVAEGRPSVWGQPSSAAVRSLYGDNLHSTRTAADAHLLAGWHALRAARLAEATREFRGAIERAGLERHPSASMRALLGLGLCAIEDVRLDAAERYLRLVVATSRDPGTHPVRHDARLALARALLWQGRIAEARVHIDLVRRQETTSIAHRITSDRLECRAWLLGGQTGRALTALARLQRDAAVCALPDALAAVLGDSARALMAVGHLDGLDLLVAGMRAARRVRSRSRIWRLRAVQLAWLVARLREDPRVERLSRRLLTRRIPGIVKLRVRYALESVGYRRTREVALFFTRWGVTPLAGWSAEGDTAMVKDLQAVLEICRDADEPLPALSRVCALVRERLGAAHVAVYGGVPEPGRLAVSGSLRLASAALAHRIAAAGAILHPVRAHDAIEAGVPVAYGGQVIGAVVCRWVVGDRADSDAVNALLGATAVAVAPHVQHALDRQAVSATREQDGAGLAGVSAAMQSLRDLIRRVGASPFHVLIEGESGSGKELVARALHAAGPRRSRKICALNCAALTDDLLEAELFGHVRGAFTGALAERAGLFEEADGGTLFLDEVGELSPRAQAKLLRAIQDGEVRRVGENLVRRVDVRIVAATNRSLRDEVSAGRFRADLLYRLDVIHITVPPLRDRSEDVAVLARRFWNEATLRLGKRATLHAATLAALARYHWPGNVRELQNTISALAVHAPARGPIGPERLPAAIGAAIPFDPPLTLDAARRSFEERFVRAALARTGHQAGLAARDLGLTRQGFRKLMTRLGIEGSSPSQEGPSPAHADRRRSAVC